MIVIGFDKNLKQQLCIDEWLELVREDKNLNGAYISISQYLDLQDKEIERLNNIIGELEKYLNDDDWTSVNGVIAIKLIKIKLKELKEGK